jgi:hypothetical protein
MESERESGWRTGSEMAEAGIPPRNDVGGGEAEGRETASENRRSEDRERRAYGRDGEERRGPEREGEESARKREGVEEGKRGTSAWGVLCV